MIKTDEEIRREDEAHEINGRLIGTGLRVEAGGPSDGPFLLTILGLGRAQLNRVIVAARHVIEPVGHRPEAVCPQCRWLFRLRWDADSSVKGERRGPTLIVRACPSGGIYDVSIRCPHCDHEEEL